jgi:hypothetical protein
MLISFRHLPKATMAKILALKPVLHYSILNHNYYGTIN